MRSWLSPATLWLLLLANGLLVWLALWHGSDPQLAQRLGGQNWSYQRHAYDHSPMASLLLARPVRQWNETGRLQLLSNHDAQFDVDLLLADDSRSSRLHITIQGRWQVSDGYLILQSRNYSMLPLDTIARGLLEHQGDMLRQLWLAAFNRSWQITLLDATQLLLAEDNHSLWLLNPDPGTG